jgi:hypothetical protein
VIVCPNPSPLIVLGRLDRLDLLGDVSAVRVTRTVLAEIHDTRDDVATRIDGWLPKGGTDRRSTELRREYRPGARSWTRRANRQGRLSHANALLRDAVEAGLHLDDTVLRRALLEFGEPWPPE